MSNFRKKIEYYAYAGQTKDEFKEYTDAINTSNINLFRSLSRYGVLFMLLMITASFIPALNLAGYRFLYFVFFAFFSLCMTAGIIIRKYAPHFATFAQYCLLAGVFVFATLDSTVFDQNYGAITACVFLFGIPIFITDKPYKITVFSLCNLAFFLICALVFKSSQETDTILRIDILNSIIFTILGIMSGFFIQTSRLSKIKQAKKIKAQNDMLEVLAKSEHDRLIEVQRQLDYDQVSGALTRDAFLRISTEMVQSKPIGHYIIICLDIQGFRRINEQYGYENGDKILRHIVESAKLEHSEDCIGCRARADTFYLIYKYDPENMKTFYDNFDTNVQQHGFDFDIHYRRGAYLIDDKSIPLIQCMDRAHLAMESVEKGVENEIAFYTKEMHSSISKQQELTDYAVTALKEGQFKVFYQPKVDFNSGSLYGAEALVRWFHPKYGIIPPNDFISLFEKDGFIRYIDRHVLEETCIFLKKLSDNGITPIPISVNMSRANVNYEYYLPEIKRIIKQYNIDPQYIHIEITERAYNENPAILMKMANALTKMGITLELDDYGSGASSEKTLMELPIGILKLDKDIVSASEFNHKNSIILSSITSLADIMGMEVIAEGIETIDMAERMMSFNCHLMQGYLFSKPIPTDEFMDLITNGRYSFDKTSEPRSTTFIKSNQIMKSVVDGSFRNLIDNSDDYIYIVDKETGKTVYANNKFRSLNSFYENGICSKILFGKARTCENCPCVIAEKTGHSETSEIRMPDGKIYISTATPIESVNGKLMFISARDVTEIHNDKEQLKSVTKKSEILEKELTSTKELNQILTAFAEISYSTFLINLENDSFTILKDSDHLGRIIIPGRPYTEQVNNWLKSEYLPPETEKLMRPIVGDIKELKKRFLIKNYDEIEYLNTKNRWTRAFFAVVNRNIDGEAQQILWLSQDIDAYKRTILESIEERIKLEYETNHDSLTGLLTRQALKEQAPDVLSDEDKKYAMAFITLTKFSGVNKDKGYIFCDEYLKTFAEKIRNANPEGLNARIREGIFAIIFEYKDSVEEKSKHIFKDLQGNFKGVPLTFSMGVSTTECCGRGYEGLCVAADAASKINADNALDEMIIADNAFIDNLINQKGKEGDTI